MYSKYKHRHAKHYNTERASLSLEYHFKYEYDGPANATATSLLLGSCFSVFFSFASNVGISRSTIVGRGSTYLMSAVGVSPLGVQEHVSPENLEKIY